VGIALRRAFFCFLVFAKGELDEGFENNGNIHTNCTRNPRESCSVSRVLLKI
jgi:hypothetical protein